MQMPFGKHRGEEIDDLPDDYLTWMYDNGVPKSQEMREEVVRVLNERGYDHLTVEDMPAPSPPPTTAPSRAQGQLPPGAVQGQQGQVPYNDIKPEALGAALRSWYSALQQRYPAGDAVRVVEDARAELKKQLREAGIKVG